MGLLDKDQIKDDVLANDDIDREEMEQPLEEKKFQQRINDTHKLVNLIDDINTDMSESMTKQNPKTTFTQSFRPVETLAATQKTDK